MDIVIGSSGTNNSNDQQENSNRSSSEKRPYHRHTNSQIEQLELFYKDCPHPDENQRRQLSRELGLELKQVKFWFQNKRTQTRAQSERADNSALREENERIQCENLAIRDALKNVICPACGGPYFEDEERQLKLQKLQMENAQLKEEHEKMSNLLAKYVGKPVSQLSQFEEMSTPTKGEGPSNAIDSLPPSYPTQIGSSSVDNLDNFVPKYQKNIGNNLSANNRVIDPILISDVEKTFMVETAASAMDELVRLLRVNEPLWIKSESSGSRAVIHHDTYEKIFPRVKRFKNSDSRMESSKESGMITVSGSQLVKMIMDPEKWTDLFPTIVCKAEQLYEVQAGTSGNKNGCLLLMNEQMHILSPFVPAREFIILRHCQQLEAGLWVVVDVSYDLKGHTPSSHCWKLPSGCMIQETANGCSKVIWIEHVEVDDKTPTHRLYKEILCNGSGYGAERWIVTLQRMYERLSFSIAENPHDYHHNPVSAISDGMKSILKLCQRMIKDFCASMCISGDNKLDFIHTCESNGTGIRVCIREGMGPGQPSGTIVNAASSLWLPLPPLHVFNFLKDEKMRGKWDIMCYGNPVNVINQITNSNNPGNCISIIKPLNSDEEGMVLAQESFIDSLGGMVVYAPIDVPAMNMAITSDDITMSVPILPSGFVISTDGHQNNTGGASTSADTSASIRSGGSLLTVIFQATVSSPTTTKVLNMESRAIVNALVTSTIQKIKEGLSSSKIE